MSPKTTVTTRSGEETFELARKMASGFEGKEAVLLFGELGAGKTVFAKGIAAGAGRPVRTETAGDADRRIIIE